GGRVWFEGTRLRFSVLLLNIYCDTILSFDFYFDLHLVVVDWRLFVFEEKKKKKKKKKKKRTRPDGQGEGWVE
ncbi:uncharacterized protein IWZ02DRAFT_483909, partial [Phyllosticta citriasiana]|uniref:uncharacterized protein n=1 Tax=Phyllosticta citriasiana TaxID=595635 RepID=UPI0030FDBDC6